MGCDGVGMGSAGRGVRPIGAHARPDDQKTRTTVSSDLKYQDNRLTYKKNRWIPVIAQREMQWTLTTTREGGSRPSGRKRVCCKHQIDRSQSLIR